MAIEPVTTIQPGELAPHEPVPQVMKDAFKAWRGQNEPFDKASTGNITNLEAVGVKRDIISINTLWEASQTFQASSGPDGHLIPSVCEPPRNVTSYSIPSIPGLIVIPSLLSTGDQRAMLSKLFHRDLSNPDHKTNLHIHYDVQYPGFKASRFDDRVSETGENGSFFGEAPDHVAFQPKNPKEHKPLTVKAALRKKLRWVTLGGQYDWTAKAYPKEEPPPFPSDIASYIHKIFPTVKPEAAIINVYSPGDTLSMHRDVSEKVERGLVSISIGCDAIFIIGLAGSSSPPVYEVLRIRSGDAIYMTGESRLAWHGVASILPGTCPDYLNKWPVGQYEGWEGWMKDKRINLNIRQMFVDQEGRERVAG